MAQVDGVGYVTKFEDPLQDGSVDFRGRVAVREKTGGWWPASLIIGPEFAKGLALSGIATNLISYLTGPMGQSRAQATTIMTSYMGLAYLFTVIGGFVADALVGRFWTMVAALILELIGLVLFTLSVILPVFKHSPCKIVGTGPTPCQPEFDRNLPVIYISLYLIAVGAGGIKACGSPFGADQFEHDHPDEQTRLETFFSWYLFYITIGEFLSITVLVHVQENVGRAVAYGIPTAFVALALVGFLCGRHWYRFQPRTSNPLTDIAQVLRASYTKRRLPQPIEVYFLHELSDKEVPPNYVKLEYSNQFRFLDKAAIIEDSYKANPFAASPWQVCTVTRIEEVKMVIRLLPIFLTTTLFYTAVAEMSRFSIAQGQSMDRHLTDDYVVPAVSVSCYLHASILATILIWEKIVVPLLRAITGNDRGLTSLQQIGAGLFLSATSMIVAFFVEQHRLRNFQALTPDEPIDVSVFFLFPQCFLMGAGEALTYSGQLAFVYNETPKGMRTLSTALSLSTLGVGYYCSSLVVSIVDWYTGHSVDGLRVGEWLPKNLNEGRLDKLYMTIAICSFINFVAYLGYSRWYIFKTVVKDTSNSLEFVRNYKEVSDEFQDEMYSSRSKSGASTKRLSKSSTCKDSSFRSTIPRTPSLKKTPIAAGGLASNLSSHSPRKQWGELKREDTSTENFPARAASRFMV